MKEIKLDEYYNFERPVGYISMEFRNTEDEIKDFCNKNKIIVSSIVKYEGYRVFGKKVRNRKTFEKAFKALTQSK